MAEVDAEDLELSRRAAIAFLERFRSRDWHAAIPDLTWDCERTLQHLINTQVYLAMQIALPTETPLPYPRGPAAASGLSVEHMLLELTAASAVLSAVIKASDPMAPAFYGGDRTDRSGVAAVACDELLIHSWDIGRGFGETFEPPQQLAKRVTGRLFPWAPADGEAWSALLWSNGRIERGDRPRLGPDWSRWLGPIADWDGRVPGGSGSGLPR